MKEQVSARRLAVIYNPTAGRAAQRRLRQWQQAAERLGATVTVFETTGPGHARTLAQQVDPARFDAVVVAGGDGTINEAVNGIVQSGLPMAIFPLGTANVLAAELGLPRDIDALARIAAFAPAQTIVPGEVVAGDAGGRLFLLMAGIGFDSDVIENLDLKLKRRLGKGAYVASIFARLWHYRSQDYAVAIDGDTTDSASVVVARAHFYGGRFVLAPDAHLNRPNLHAVVFRRNGRWAALSYLVTMAMGLLSRHPQVSVRAAKSIELRGPAGAPVHVDGDICARLPAIVRLAATPVQLIAMPKAA